MERCTAPQVSTSEVLLASRCRRVFANAHTYHINSISVNSDQETFLSADDLRINLWSLERSDQSFNIVDIKPANMEDLTEVRNTQHGAAQHTAQHGGWRSASSCTACCSVAGISGIRAAVCAPLLEACIRC